MLWAIGQPAAFVGPLAAFRYGLGRAAARVTARAPRLTGGRAPVLPCARRADDRARWWLADNVGMLLVLLSFPPRHRLGDLMGALLTRMWA